MDVSQYLEIFIDETKEHLQNDNMRKPKGAGSNIYLLDENPNRSILIECGFLSNSEDERLLSSSAWQLRLAQAIASGVMRFLSESAC